MNRFYVVRTALIVALGGFLMGFDASVISGVVGFIETEFSLSNIQLGWAVASLTLTSTLAMMVAGPLSDRYGRRTLLYAAATLYAISAIGSALAPSFWFLVVARMIGGFGVGASLIIAPMYIAELAPPAIRGQMVSFNQLNIVLGISVAFFTNYLILQLGDSESAWVQSLGIETHNWRWMLGLETLPAVLYFFGLFIVPESPRWLIMRGRESSAFSTMEKASGREAAEIEMEAIKNSLHAKLESDRASLREVLANWREMRFFQLFAKPLRLVLLIGVVMAIVQQITGINAVFFYAPMIFEQSGIGTDASFVQAILVGLVNLVFTIIAIMLIDRVGRKPLLCTGLAGMAISLIVLAGGFYAATFTLTEDALTDLPEGIEAEALMPIVGQTFSSDLDYKNAIAAAVGSERAIEHESDLIARAIDANPTLILLGILFFVASFAASAGPVMWVLFSELFPNAIRGIAISFVGLINSGTSFSVQLVFPWELDTLGSGTTFLLYGIFAAIGFVFMLILLPETKGRSLEELEEILVRPSEKRPLDS